MFIGGAVMSENVELIDFKAMTAEELKERNKDYIKQIKELYRGMAEYINTGKGGERELREQYAELKKKITEEAKHFDALKNDIGKISNTHHDYQEGIKECAAYGFAVKANARITTNTLHALDEAEHKLEKYMETF